MADLIGQNLGQYEILALLGEGGMAAVYRARQANIGRDVAIKVIKHNLIDNTEFIKRFEREAQTLASLSHPFIVKVFDYGHQSDLVYLAMELLVGGSLAGLIKHGPIPLDVADRVLDQIASALDYGHEQGIIHRDLKPQNILLDEKGNAFLTDFGIVRLATTFTMLTQSGVALGTPAYMAPEQWHGSAVDARADIYSLSVTLFEMLSAHLPFVGETPASTMYKHLQEPPPFLRDVRADLPPGIDDVIQKGLAKNPTDRFDSAGELSSAFKSALVNRPVSIAAAALQDNPTAIGVAVPQLTPIVGTAPSPSPAPRFSRSVRIGTFVFVIILFGVLLIALLNGRGYVAPNATSTSGIQAAIQPTGAADLLPSSTPTGPTATLYSASATPAIILSPPLAALAVSPSLTISQTPVLSPPLQPSRTTILSQVSTGRPLPSSTPTPSATLTATHSPTAIPPTPSLTSTNTPTPRPSATLTVTHSPTAIPPTPHPTSTSTPTPSATPTSRPSATLTVTHSPTAIPPTPRPTSTSTPTSSATPTSSLSATPTATYSPTATYTPTTTFTITASVTASATKTPVPIDQSLTVNVCGNDLCVINYKGGRAPLGLTSYTGFRGASFSPDGTHIVFSACLIAELTNPACWDLFIIDRISKSVTPLIRDPNTITVTPAWSPDGEWIAYNSGCNLALIRVDGSDEQTLMVAPGGPDSLCLYPFQAWTVAWSPDSKQIATVLGINHTTSFDSPTDVWVVNADGSGDVRPILHSDRHIIAMAWSPDNQSVEVDLDNAKSYQLDPYCNSKPNGCDATSRTLTKTIPKTWFANYYPQWAGAAATVTPATSASTNATLTATNSLAASQGSIVSICNGDLCILPPTGASIYLGLNASYTNFYGESWSPDGTRIVFSACRIVDFRNQKCMELFITSADGKTVTPLGQGANFMPAWSPDGKQIAYNFCGVSIIRPDGYGKTEVLPCLTTYHVSVDTSFLHPIAWSPNSRQLAVLMGVAHNENPAAPYVDPPTRVWIIDSYRSGTIRTIFKASQSITALAWSPDGRSVVVALQDGTAYKIDASCKPQGDACDASSQTKIDSVPVSWIANFYPQWAGETVSR